MGSQWGKDGKVEKVKGEAYWERRVKRMKREVEGQATRRCKCNWQSSVAAASSSRLWIFIRIIFEIPDFHRRSWWQTNHRPSMTKIAEKMTKYVQGFLFIITCSSRKSGCVCVRNPAGAAGQIGVTWLTKIQCWGGWVRCVRRHNRLYLPVIMCKGMM